MNEHPDRHSIRRIILPSGRLVEVVGLHAPLSQPRGLHICPTCDSNLVQPLRWKGVADGIWELTLRCPNCGWFHEGVFDREQVDLLEEQLDDGLSEILADLKRLAQANMLEEVERFTTALHADLILPEDF